MIRHNIRLIGSGMKGARISALTFKELLSVLVDGSKGALRFRAEGRSTARGADPSWLMKAADFELVQLSEGSTILTIDSPPVVEAAPEKFAQKDIFWRNLEGTESAFEMFEEVLSDATVGKADSDLFDESLLAVCIRLSAVFARGVENIEITNGSPLSPRLIVTPEQIEQVATLRKQTPMPQVAKVSGIMNMIRASDKVFELCLESGESIRGIAQEHDTDRLGQLFGKRVLVGGRVVFRPSGGILRIEATKIEAVDSTPALWAKAPKPIGRIDLRTLHKPQNLNSGMSKVFGAWPGTESDEEIERLMG